MPPRLIDAPCCHLTHPCHLLTNPLRFSTSTPSPAQIPPESPKFIEIPRLIQPKQPFPLRTKGILPVPRPIFGQRPRPQDRDKASPEYLADVTPEPITNKTIPNADSRTADFVSWKARLAETRRRNLREGLIELKLRKMRTERFLEARGRRSMEERNRLLTQPEREDERLTSPTILQSERELAHKTHHILPDPHRTARLALKHQNLQRTSSLIQESKLEYLHNLYIHAGNYITTSKQLDNTIDRVFDDGEQFMNDDRPGLNVWNLGTPETVRELLQMRSKDPRRGKAKEAAEENKIVSRERMRRVGEELTGGKMLKGGR